MIALSSLPSRMGNKTIVIDNISKGYDGKVLFRDFSYTFGKLDRIGEYYLILRGDDVLDIRLAYREAERVFVTLPAEAVTRPARVARAAEKQTKHMCRPFTSVKR